MSEIVWAFAAVVAVGLVLTAGAVAALAAVLRRRNRVDPSVRCAAPRRWLWSPARGARLHRRLRAAVATAVAADAPPDLVRELRAAAVALDARVVLAGRAAPARTHAAWGRLGHDVTCLERLAWRLAGLDASSPEDGAPTDAVRALTDRLDALDAARVEVAQAERRAGPVRGGWPAGARRPRSQTPPPPDRSETPRAARPRRPSRAG